MDKVRKYFDENDFYVPSVEGPTMLKAAWEGDGGDEWVDVYVYSELRAGYEIQIDGQYHATARTQSIVVDILKSYFDDGGDP
jgi:hypothetical protein